MSYMFELFKRTHCTQFLKGSSFFDECVHSCNSLTNLSHLTHRLKVAVKVTLKQMGGEARKTK
jgi:hypothetical protein